MKTTLTRTRFLRRACAVFGIVAAGFFAGCPSAKDPEPSTITGNVRIKGSNTFGEELAPRLIEEYRRTRPNVSIALESKGSASGFAALLTDECDIAASSRPVTEEETARFQASGRELNDYLIGYYGVAVIVNADNPVDHLSKEQVGDIFTGAIQNWNQVGGPDAAIHVFIRDPVSGTNLGFRELAMENRSYAENARTFTSYRDLASAVSDDTSALGYASMGLKTEGIKTVRIGRTAPDYLSVNEGWYPYARALRLYTIKARETAAARDFALFVQRREGQEILDELGFVRRFEKKLSSSIPD